MPESVSGGGGEIPKKIKNQNQKNIYIKKKIFFFKLGGGLLPGGVCSQGGVYPRMH